MAAAATFDDFESYPVGSNLHNQRGWTGWLNNPGVGALVVTNFAFSPIRSVNITGPSDFVRTFSNATNGQWVFSVMQYIPSTSTGTNYIILMNQYQPPYATTNDLSWSVQIQNNLDTGQIISDFGGGATLPMVTGQWVQVRCEINLAAKLVSEFYNGQFLGTHVWNGVLGFPGLNEIQALDLFANNAGPVYYDNVQLTLLLPTITCPADITTNIVGPCVVVNYQNPTVVNGTLQSSTRPSGSQFPLGTTLVTCTATNASATNTCTFTVTVQQTFTNCLLFASRKHCPLGAASLVNSSNQLIVGNLGSSGQDGVDAALGQAEAWEVVLVTNRQASLLPTGAYLVADTYGMPQGAATEQRITSTRIEDISSGLYRHLPGDFDGLEWGWG